MGKTQRTLVFGDLQDILKVKRAELEVIDLERGALLAKNEYCMDCDGACWSCVEAECRDSSIEDDIKKISGEWRRIYNECIALFKEKNFVDGKEALVREIDKLKLEIRNAAGYIDAYKLDKTLAEERLKEIEKELKDFESSR